MGELRKAIVDLPVEHNAFLDSYNNLQPGCKRLGTAEEALDAVVAYLRRKKTTLNNFSNLTFKKTAYVGRGKMVGPGIYDTKDIIFLNVRFFFNAEGALTFAQINIAYSGASGYIVEGHPTKFLS